jgi:hypothetical protein
MELDSSSQAANSSSSISSLAQTLLRGQIDRDDQGIDASAPDQSDGTNNPFPGQEHLSRLSRARIDPQARAFCSGVSVGFGYSQLEQCPKVMELVC